MSVLNHLKTTASNLVLSDTEKSSINTSISTLRIRLNDWFGSSSITQLKFGSSTRGTILPRKADQKSDIDYMIIFNNDAGYKPQTFIDRLRKFAQNKYNTSQIAQSHPTVVLSLNHIKFDLVPAYEDWWSKYIPAPKSDYTDWLSTSPNDFNKELTDKNDSNYSLIKPMIRLVKYWNAQNGYVYDSYELEKSLVANGYWSCFNLKDYFFSAIDDLSTWNLPQYKTDKVERAKRIVQDTKTYEQADMAYQAENEIKKIIPVLY
ncbi:SMODS domain-containing nucleotidyltransferase [Ekhidna sp.]|uniref:SMODS domain-containing nucleotidyltransferase n=1 Tax=Ekhidna sp. TaxID=2608089 RepID=UPI003CCB87D3